ncbi:EcoAI/FtnUII family type I restriction enzme subunit R [Vibrio parahaemolyticus]
MRQRNEADTRVDLIEPLLEKVGWKTVPSSFIRREVICPGKIQLGGKRARGVASDYVLVYQGRKLAAVEAKSEKLSYTEGVRQAKDYAKRLNCRFGYATNGHEIYQIDTVTKEEKLVERFLSPEEMWALTFEKKETQYSQVWRERFTAVPMETQSGTWLPRYYQENAINAALDAVAKGASKILLTLATGTGKTSIAFQIAWKLYNSKWSVKAQKKPELAKRRPRILFLADRNILANQAFNDFSPFGEDAIIRISPDEVRKNGGVPKNGSVFFTIFQTFMSGKDSEGNDAPYFGSYSPDFFDFIIIDECHRGGANDESSWRGILEYFSSAVQLGLTATPKRLDNANTYKYFGKPVYSYDLKSGINDGFLTPFKVYTIVGTLDKYTYLPGDGVVVRGEVEPGRVYEEKDFNHNRGISIPAREEKRVHYWMDRINPNEKTIVFCMTQEHAGEVRDLVNQYAQKKGWSDNLNYCVRITADDGKAGEADLELFSDNEKTIPTIVTTSRKLSTGVDARNVRNIVLMRPCTDMIEFKQIIGRGTRLYDKKDFFSVFDFVQAHHNFSDPDWDGEPEGGATLNSDEEVCSGPIPPDMTDEENESPSGNGAKGNGTDSGDTTNVPPPTPAPDKLVVQLNDGRKRQIKHMHAALYWGSVDGKPITAHEFLQQLYGDLPRFFQNEDELRSLWSDPTTRDKLLDELAENEYDQEKLEALKTLIDAPDSDVYDVLMYVAYEKPALTRAQRAALAKASVDSEFTEHRQQEFINFVLNHYIEGGVSELSMDKMRPLVELKYNTINDAVAEFGEPQVLRNMFLGLQKHLYEAKQ